MSHKKVRAAKIVAIVGDTAALDPHHHKMLLLVEPAPGVQEEFEPTRPDLKHAAEVGGYAVIYAPDEKYPEGYRSISPAKAFEEGYTRVDE